MADYNFFRRGGADQLRIEKPADLEAVETLDKKLWVALSMPVAGQELDARTLTALDTDRDGRVRVAEILAAVKFVRAELSDFDAFFSGRDTIPLSSLASEGSVRSTAQALLARLGKAGASAISLADVDSATKNFDAQPFNGDGVLVPASAGDDAALAAFLADAVAATGGADDASGEKGATEEIVAAFVKSASDVLAWREKADASASAVLPLGGATEAAFAAFAKIRTKAEDFFARVRLASFDASAAGTLNPGEAAFAALAGTEISAAASEAFPLARVAPTDGEPTLPLFAGVNPAWATVLADFSEKTLVPAAEKIGLDVSAGMPTSLPASLWAKVAALFAPYEAWLAEKPATGAHVLSSERLREVVGGNFAERLAPLFEKEAAEKPLRDALGSAERLCLFSRDLAVVLRNFVSFAEFYKRGAADTAFLVGRLYMDGRACSLCVRVADAGAHAALAAKSNCCLVYCDCVRKSGGEKMSVVAMFGDGDALSLYVGRNGVFYDKKGDDWDAKIVKIVENPISIRQAFWAPYRKLAKFVETQIEGFAAAREKKVDGELSSGAGTALTRATSAEAPEASAKPAFDVAKFAGIFAAIGLALGAIGAALSVAISGFLSLAPWQMLLAVVAVVFVISAPSMLIAAMKLRRRSLGPILEASGWAINGNVKINIPLGKAFTEMPRKPEGSRVSRIDPYREKTFPWGKVLVSALVLAVVAAAAFLLLRGNGAAEQSAPAPVVEAVAAPASSEAPAPEAPAADNAEPPAGPNA